MRRVAALYDIHGNLPALRAVLAELRRERLDAVVVGGDVAAGPLPAETLSLLQTLTGARFVQGNADRETVERFDAGPAQPAPGPGQAATFAAGRITRAQRNFLDSFEQTVELQVEGLGTVLFCHGSPRSDTEIITTATADERLREILDGVSAPVIVAGHTHRQFDRQIGRWRMINAGSVGSPYEGHAAAYWALLGPGVELRRTDYEIPAALAELRASGIPDFDDLFRESLLEPMDPDQVAALFERQAAG